MANISFASKEAILNQDVGLNDLLSMFLIDTTAPNEDRFLLFLLIIKLDDEKVAPAIRPQNVLLKKKHVDLVVG